MKNPKKRPVQTGNIDVFSIFKIERFSYEDKNTGKQVKTNTVRLTFKNETTGSFFNTDFRLNVWADPRRVYKEADMTEDGQKAALKAYMKKVNKFNDLQSAIASGEADDNDANQQKLQKLYGDIPHVSIGYEQLTTHLENIGSVVGVDVEDFDYDLRMLNFKAEYKKNKKGQPMRLVSSYDMANELDLEDGTFRVRSNYAGTKYDGCYDINSTFDFQVYDSLIKQVTKELYGKKFWMTVGGEYRFSDNSGPHPSISKTTKPELYLASLDRSQEAVLTQLKYSEEVHVDTSNKLTVPEVPETPIDGGTEDVPF